MTLCDADYIERALFLAERGRGRTSPNPLVGAVIVSASGEVVGQGYHERAGEPHAEVRALNLAGERARGATMYCTLEPCCHVGRTGPCVHRIVEAGIARVVASMEDPNPAVQGRGFAYLRARRVEVDVGPGREQSIRMNQPFLTLMRSHRPFVILKAATSADGYIARSRSARTYLTAAAANRHTHAFRAEVDAIGVGVGTVIADDPLLTVRGVYRQRPLTRVVFDRRLRTPTGARLLSTLDSGPVIIVTTPRAWLDDRRELEARGALVEVAADDSLSAALDCLGSRLVGSLLLEGGAALHGAAWDERVVDFVRLYVASAGIGPGGVPFLENRDFLTSALIERRVESLGADTLIEGYVHRPH
jgi:diaminohydroxyphosphoribosylaminopyrimidine deaminase / 5-amino-6-(5-phosphoribosylamino)uracil reductase